MPIEWYEHPDDEHTAHHVYYSHRMPDENWYGFEPPESGVPAGHCTVCGCELWNEDDLLRLPHSWDEPVCEECEAAWQDDQTIIKLLSAFRDAVVEWAVEECQAIRDEHEDELWELFKTPTTENAAPKSDVCDGGNNEKEV